MTNGQTDGRRDGWTDGRMNNPEAICPSNFFEVGGIKICVSYFFMRNPYKKFQNSSMHGSKVMLCIKKHDEWTNGRTNAPEAICPSNFYEVGGIKRVQGRLGWVGGARNQLVSFSPLPATFPSLIFEC